MESRGSGSRLRPFFWRDPDGHERLAAKVVDGKAVRFSIDLLSPFMVFERPPWYQDGAWLLAAALRESRCFGAHGATLAGGCTRASALQGAADSDVAALRA